MERPREMRIGIFSRLGVSDAARLHATAKGSNHLSQARRRRAERREDERDAGRAKSRPASGPRSPGSISMSRCRPNTEANLVSAIATYGVLVFPRQRPERPDARAGSAACSATLWTTPAHAAAKPRFAYPHLFDAGNLTADGRDQRRQLASHAARATGCGTPIPRLPRTARLTRLLLAHEVPSEGGADLLRRHARGLRRALPGADEGADRGLQALHSWWFSRRQGRLPGDRGRDRGRQPQAVHPLVHVHPGSGRKSLHRQPCARRGRHGAAEGRALLAELIEHRDADRPSPSTTPGGPATW